MTVVTCDTELVRHLEGIGWLLDQGKITEDQAGEMIRRARSRATGGWPAGQDLAPDERAARAITNSPGPYPIPRRAGGAMMPAIPIERLRQLTPEQRWQALVFLSGLVPGAVDRALAAVLTPGSTAGTVR